MLNLAPRAGIAGLDENLHIDQAHAALGLPRPGRVRSRPGARAGVAGYLSSRVRRQLPRILKPQGNENSERLGERAAAEAYKHGVYFQDWTYLVCTNRSSGTLRWRKGRQETFGSTQRLMPLVLDSGAFRIHSGRASRWASLENYLQAIDLTSPRGFAAFDVIGDQEASRERFERMSSLGYGPERGCFPVWQVRELWNGQATVTGLNWRALPEGARCAVANARIAARDPTLRHYAQKSGLIGLGGMVQGPIPRDYRACYIAELCRCFPDHQFWALGQANYKVVNGLGQLERLARVWVDGSWWIHGACTSRFGVIKNGLIHILKLEGTGARCFFTLVELMAANLRCILGAYAGLWQFPTMRLLPDLEDEGDLRELKTHLRANQLSMFGPQGLLQAEEKSFAEPAQVVTK